ncbi:MAG: 30S ribosomal protein S24e [Methanobacteriota archaeon]
MVAIDITAQRENPLLKRTEIHFVVNHGGEPTPKRDAVREKLAGKIGKPVETLVIDNMVSEFGRGVTRGYAKVYGSVEAVKKSEPHFLLVRHKLAEKKVKAEAAAGGAAKAAPKKR